MRQSDCFDVQAQKEQTDKISRNKVSTAKLSLTVIELSLYIFVVHMF